jgi:site-specific DNA-cytosine methylase
LEAPVLAMRAMGFHVQHVFSSEVIAYKRDFIRLNSPGVPLYEDMSKRDHSSVPDCDLYVCGFPCKPWSSLHSRTKLFREPGAKVFSETVETIRVTQPPAVVLENVAGIRKVMPRILRTLKQLGYAIVVLDIDPRDAGEPASRPRVYFVLVRMDRLAVKDEGAIAEISRGLLGGSPPAAPLADRLLPEGCDLLLRFPAPAEPRSKARAAPARSSARAASAPAASRSKRGTRWQMQLRSLPRVPLSPPIAGIGERITRMLEVLTAKAGLNRLPSDQNIDVSQSFGRCRFTSFVPTITPGAKIVIGCRRRLLSPIEMLLLNGIPVGDLVWPASFASRHFADMAGNTMHCAAAPPLA